MKRFWLTIAAVLVSLALIAAVIVHFINQVNGDQPGRAIVASEMMDYCRSDMNTSPDKQAQLWFLRTNKLLIWDSKTHISMTFGSGDNQIIVRYFASDKETPAAWRCHFILVQWANRPERNAATLHYERDGQTFVPQDRQICLSTLPPRLGEGTATLRCDLLWQE